MIGNQFNKINGSKLLKVKRQLPYDLPDLLELDIALYMAYIK
jgi:hypothetical protein